MDGPEKFALLALPSDLQLLIASKLPCRDLVRLSSTCKRFQTVICDPLYDERLWKDNLPSFCLDAGLGLQYYRWREHPHVCENEACDAARGLNLGNTTITSYRHLSCEVDKSHQTLLSDAAKSDKTLAEHCLHVSDLKWNSGYTLHADIALACATSEAPSLRIYVQYVLLAFMECQCLERTALLIRKAVDVIHENNILGMLGETQPSWLDFNAGSAEENTVAARQLATMVALMAHCFRLSQSSLQGVIEREKREQLQLLPLPQVFESLLSSEAQPPDPQPQNAPSDENPSDSTEPPPPGPVDVEMGPQSPSPVERVDIDGDGCGAGSLEAGAPAEEGTGRSSPDVAIEEFSFTFLGATFSSLDFGRAVRVLSHIDRRPELLAYVLRPADAAVSVDIPGLVPLLRPAVADVVQQVLVAPRDFQKEFAACHLWQHVAREEAGAAYEVMSPPYMCNRRSVWLTAASYMATYLLMRCKSRNEPILSHMEMPAEHSDNVLVGCLIELTMELYSLGFLLAARNTSLLALLQNEASLRSDVADMRYVLVGQFVDIHVTLLENNHVRAAVDTPRVLRDCVQWVLALFRLATPPLFQLNSNFVQRLSKVLFCCMLRLPHVEQQRRCAKAALALCRLCLQRVAIGHRPPVPELPLPQVDSRTLPQSMLGWHLAASHCKDEAPCRRTSGSSCRGGPAGAEQPRAAAAAGRDAGAAVPGGDRGMLYLRRWLNDESPEELDEYLAQQSLEEASSSSAAEVAVSAAPAKRKEPFWWSLLWFRRRRPESPGDAAAADSTTCPWLGKLQYVSGEIEAEQQWADYEVELTAILGLQGGREAIVALMPVGGQGEGGPDGGPENPAHIISRLFECLAQVCSALGLFSLAALFYAHSVEIVRHLAPDHVLEDQLDPLQPGTAPLTAARYVASTLNHLANELITSADYLAALRTLVFSRTVCMHELQTRSARWQGADGRAANDSDTNEVYALLTCSTAQLVATVLELRIRQGLQTFRVSVPQWPPQAGGADTRTVEVPSTFEYMHELAWEAYRTASGRHVDSCLQALFVLGDISLVTYNLAEARRIFALTGLAAADGAVQHYNLMSQCQSFSAIAGLSLGDASMCRCIAMRCMLMYSFPRSDPLFQYTADADAEQARFHAALDRTFGDPVELQRCGGVLPLGATPRGSAVAAPPPDGAADAAVASEAGAAAGQVEREAVTEASLEGQETEQILLRAMCEVNLQGRDPHHFLSMLRMRAMHLHMDGCPVGDEEQRMEEFRQQIAEVGVPHTFRAAAIAACVELRQLPTRRAVSSWLMQHIGAQVQVQQALGQNAPAAPQQQHAFALQQILNQEHVHAFVPWHQMIGLAAAAPHPGQGEVVAAVQPPPDTQPPQNAAIWELLSFSEQPGAIPPAGLLSRFMSASMPGMQLSDDGDSTRRASLLNEAARMSIQHVSEHVALEHVDCEEMELTAISFFMHQVSLQVHALYGNPACAKVALSQLASRPNDEIGQVHIWYWGGAVAMHLCEWRRSTMLFRAAACSTQQYPHASMRAKAFVGIVEAMLAAVVSRHCPDLGIARFLAAVQGRSCAGAEMAHSELCAQLGATLRGLGTEGDGGARDGSYTLHTMRQHIEHALSDARAVGDDGVELRALSLAQFILQVEGSATWDPASKSLQWSGAASCQWLLQESMDLPALRNRFNSLTHRLARNVFVTRKLLGCHVVLDPRRHVEMHLALKDSA